MGVITADDVQPPVTFRDAPTIVRSGRKQLTDDAARELGDQLAVRYRTLLEKLAEE